MQGLGTQTWGAGIRLMQALGVISNLLRSHSVLYPGQSRTMHLPETARGGESGPMGWNCQPQGTAGSRVGGRVECTALM